MKDRAEGHPASDLDVPSTQQRNWPYVVFILTLLSTFNYLDRQIVNILAEPIKRELHLADWQLGVLTGFAFAVVYALAAIPLARLAERGSRPLILGVCLAVWSLFTMLAGFTRNFAEFALTRLGVGLGEAGSSPPAHALIVDVTPVDRRALALGCYQAGVPLGTLAGMALGGILADQYGWRTALVAAGFPGLLLAAILLATVRDPRQLKPRDEVRATFMQDARGILQSKAFLFLMIGGSFSTLTSFGTQAFMGSFYLRNHGPELQQVAHQLSATLNVRVGEIAFVGTSLGLLKGLAGIFGTILGGWLSDRTTRGDNRTFAYLIAIPQFASAPVMLAGLFWPNLTGALVLLTLPAFLVALSIAPTWTALQALATDATRATAVALGFLIVTFSGLGFGPLLVGVVSDLLNMGGLSSAEALRWSMVAVVVPSMFGAFLTWQIRRYMPPTPGRLMTA